MPDNKQDQEPNGEELEARLAEKENELAEKSSRISELEQTLASRDDQIADLKQSVANLEQRLTEAEESLSQAVSSYRALVIKTNPGIPEEQIVGDSIEEIEASLASARALIDRVRQELEAEIAAAKIPAGAPLRTPADLSALSPRDKIQYAIGERR